MYMYWKIQKRHLFPFFLFDSIRLKSLLNPISREKCITKGF